MQNTNTDDTKRHLRHIVAAWPDGDFTFEIRANTPRGWLGRFFKRNDIDKVPDALARLSDDTRGVFVTFNPTTRPPTEHWSSTPLTRDSDIARRSWLVVDIDPTRPADTGSTDDELARGERVRDSVRHKLTERGFPAPSVVMSGNGWHLWYAIDKPNDDESRGALKNLLAELADTCSTDTAKVDKSLSNAARIIKLVGTTARKGEATVDRPHRTARFDGDLARIEKVGADLIDGFTSSTLELAPTKVQHTAPRAEYTDEHSKQARRAFEGIVTKLAQTPNGERNNLLFWATTKSAPYVGAGLLDEGHVRRELVAAARAVGLTDAEIDKTMSSGWGRSINEPPSFREQVTDEDVERLNMHWLTGELPPTERTFCDVEVKPTVAPQAPTTVARYDGAQQEVVLLRAYLRDVFTTTPSAVARLASRRWVTPSAELVFTKFEPGSSPDAVHIEAVGIPTTLAQQLAEEVDKTDKVAACLEYIQDIDRRRRGDKLRGDVAFELGDKDRDGKPKPRGDAHSLRRILDEHDDTEARHNSASVYGVDAMRAHLARVQADHALGRSLSGFKTGVLGIDYLTNGLAKTILFGGASGIGKTNLLLAAARGVLTNEPDAAVVYLSFEQTPFTLYKRCICALADLTMRQCSRGVSKYQDQARALAASRDSTLALNPNQVARFNKAHKQIEDWSSRFALLDGNELPDARRSTIVGVVRDAARRFGVSTDKVCLFFDSFTSALPRMIQANARAQAKDIQDGAIDELARIQHDIGGALVSIAELNKANMISAAPGVDAFTGSGHIVHRVDMAGALVKGAWLNKVDAAATGPKDDEDLGDKSKREAEVNVTPMRLVFVKARDEGIANLPRWLVHNHATQAVYDSTTEEAAAYAALHAKALEDKKTRTRKGKGGDSELPI